MTGDHQCSSSYRLDQQYTVLCMCVYCVLTWSLTSLRYGEQRGPGTDSRVRQELLGKKVSEWDLKKCSSLDNTRGRNDCPFDECVRYCPQLSHYYGWLLIALALASSSSVNVPASRWPWSSSSSSCLGYLAQALRITSAQRAYSSGRVTRWRKGRRANKLLKTIAAAGSHKGVHTHAVAATHSTRPAALFTHLDGADVDLELRIRFDLGQALYHVKEHVADVLLKVQHEEAADCGHAQRRRHLLR